MLRWIVMALVVLGLPLFSVTAEKVYRLVEDTPPVHPSKIRPPQPSEPVDLFMFKRFIVVDLSAQQIDLYQDGVKIFSTPCATGTDEKATRKGLFHVTNKHKKWTSTIYGVSMPHFLRVSHSDFGLHAGYLPGYPASHGCIRMPEDAASHLFDITPIGTPVLIQGTPPDKEWIKQQYRVKHVPTSHFVSKGPKAARTKPKFNPPFPIIPLGSTKKPDEVSAKKKSESRN